LSDPRNISPIFSKPVAQQQQQEVEQNSRREEVSPAPPMNNVTVDSAYTSAYSPATGSPQVEQQQGKFSTFEY
jgi:hypothetical protein